MQNRFLSASYHGLQLTSRAQCCLTFPGGYDQMFPHSWQGIDHRAKKISHKSLRRVNEFTGITYRNKNEWFLAGTWISHRYQYHRKAHAEMGHNTGGLCKTWRQFNRLKYLLTSVAIPAYSALGFCFALCCCDKKKNTDEKKFGNERDTGAKSGQNLKAKAKGQILKHRPMEEENYLLLCSYTFLI